MDVWGDRSVKGYKQAGGQDCEPLVQKSAPQAVLSSSYTKQNDLSPPNGS